MSLELLKIRRRATPPGAQESLGRKAVRLAAERPHLLALAAPVALAGGGLVVVASSAVAGIGIAAGGEWRIRRRAGEAVRVIDQKEVRFFKALPGDHLREGVIYVRHPKVGRRDLLIPAKHFHQFVVNEQIAEIVSYLRSTLRMASLKIFIKSETGGNLVVKGVPKAVPAAAWLRGAKVEETAFEQSFDRPTRMPHPTAQPVWLADFPQIQAAAQDARHGSFKFSQTFDYSFGLEAGVARAAGIKGDWLSNYTFEIHATFA